MKTRAAASIDVRSFDAMVDSFLALAVAKRRSREIIRMRCGLGNRPPLTLARVGIEYDLSKERIRQVEADILKEMRESPHLRLLSPVVDFVRQQLRRCGGLQDAERLAALLAAHMKWAVPPPGHALSALLRLFPDLSFPRPGVVALKGSPCLACAQAGKVLAKLVGPTGQVAIPRTMEAVADCIDRDAEFVREYLTANLELDAQAELPPDGVKPDDEAKKPKGDNNESDGKADGDEGETEPEENDEEIGEADDGDEDELPPEDEEGNDTPPQTEKPSKAKEPTFMDRYAKSRGFRWHEAERCYTHTSGAWIAKGDAPFNWQEGVNGSDVIKRLFVAEASLAGGVEIPYELWRLMEINPDSISLVLCAEDGKPNEWSANELQELKSSGQIHLHQSRFILKETTQ